MGSRWIPRSLNPRAGEPTQREPSLARSQRGRDDRPDGAVLAVPPYGHRSPSVGDPAAGDSELHLLRSAVTTPCRIGHRRRALEVMARLGS